MTNLCLNCGYDNRSGARFCATCGGTLPAGAPLSPPSALSPWQPPSAPASLQNAPPAPLFPAPPPAAAPQAPRRNWLQQIFHPNPLVIGRVLIDPIERYQDPPMDWGRVLLLASLLAAFAVPFLIHPEAIAQLFWAVMIVMAMLFLPMIVAGMAGFRSVAPMLNPLSWLSLGASLVPRGGQQAKRSEVPYYSFKIEDAQTGQTVGVQMIGHRKGGDLSLGDEVQVWGRLDRAHNVIRGRVVQVDSSMGAVASYKVSTAREIPLWIGPTVAVLLLAVTLLTT